MLVASSAEQRGERAEEIGGGGDAQGGALGYGGSEVFDVVGEQPIGFAGNGR